jgi:hypothetical protein
LPTCTDDVIEAVNFARAAGLRVAAQSTGHGAYALAAGDGTLLVKLENMRGVEIDAANATAKVEGGAQWGDVTAAASPHGLAALAGSAADVGVSGYTVGGGLSWLARKYGLSCNSVTAIEIVTPAGELVRADATENPDLFWAVRGGGGAFGVITGLELALYPVTEVFGGMMLWPIERDREVLNAWRQWVDTVPDEVTSLGRLLHFPPIPDIPEPFRGREFVGIEAVSLLDPAESEALIAPLRALGPEMDTFGMMPADRLAELHMDPPGPVPGLGNGIALTDVTPETIDTIVGIAGAGTGSPLISVEMRHCGGALSTAPQNAGSLPCVDGFTLYAVGIAPVPPLVEAVVGALGALIPALAPWNAERQVISWRETQTPGNELFGAQHERLLQVQAQIDPDGLMQSAHPL